MSSIINQDELNKLMENGTLVVLKFSAVWCGPCKNMAKVIEEVAPQYPDVTFAECDIEDADQNFVKSFGVRNIPYTVFMRNGEILDKNVGLMKKSALKDRIDKVTGGKRDE